jgi:D-serine deaminase-like pyridoxal phosphate-dependent protein
MHCHRPEHWGYEWERHWQPVYGRPAHDYGPEEYDRAMARRQLDQGAIGFTRSTPAEVRLLRDEGVGYLTGSGTTGLRVGGLLRVVPNHACGTTNMWSGLHVVEDGHTAGHWPIRARH